VVRHGRANGFHQSPSMIEVAPDRAAHRAWLVSFVTLADGMTAVDLGCGRGDDLRLLANLHPAADVRLLGVDASEESLAAATAHAADSRVAFQHARLSGRLPFGDASFDLVYSHNLLECVPDPRVFALEVARILRPGGRVVIGHWDWDSQLYDGANKALVRRLVVAYADWQQAWMDHADGWMGRRLWGVFNATRCFEGEPHARVLTTTIYEAPWFGHENARAFRSLVSRGLASAVDCERFEREQAELSGAGRYFYSINGFAYVGHRNAR
jgi:SAM-dependent methyltransferase